MNKFESISQDQFKNGMRKLAAAVNVITVEHEGFRDGLTATAVCSVSAEPPQLLICVNSQTHGHKLIRQSKYFALNIMARDQEEIAMRFAGMDGTERSQRFDKGSWSKIITGAPCLNGALVNFDCEVINEIEAGTHSIFIGHIVGSRISGDDNAPLIYGEGKFTGLMN
tara:strand:+ start:998 stop:1501 length:504 start_codon:yes stop_codon:yes gene_type:complete